MLRARLALDRIKPSDIQTLNHRAKATAAQHGSVRVQREALARVGFIIALLGRRLPWRSDCLVQAVAAQSWLADLGIASQICIGVDAPHPNDFAAHAWLVSGDWIVTGGTIEPYAVIIGETGSSPDPE